MRRIMMMTAATLMVVSLAGCGDDDGAATTEAPGAQAPSSSTTVVAPTSTTPATTTTDAYAPTDTAPEAGPSDTAPPDSPTEFAISTPAFDDGGPMPVTLTCDGDNASPELHFDGIPPGTVSLALTVVDPDGGDWIHWVVWNIPPGTYGLPPGIPVGELPDGVLQGRNDFAQAFNAGDLFPGGAPVKIDGWDGPCPPGGIHRYVFTLYALTGTIDLPEASPAAEILAAIENARADGSLIGETSMLGLYGR